MNHRMQTTLVRSLERSTPDYLERSLRFGWLRKMLGKPTSKPYLLLSEPSATVVAAVKLPRNGGAIIDQLVVFKRILSHEEILRMLPFTGRGWHRVYFLQHNHERQYYINGEAVSLDHYYPKEGEQYVTTTQEENR